MSMPSIQDREEELKHELRAVREEQARRGVTNGAQLGGGSLVTPPRDIAYARLTELTDDQLAEHEERLERDLDDLVSGFEADIEGTTVDE